MDFMRLLKSLEELLYEAMVMLVFFPLTLWMTFRHPQRMMDYADTELGDVQSEQYKDTLSPPLFLMICLLVSHLAERVVPSPNAGAVPAFFRDTQNLLIFRVFIFSLLPLVMSLRLMQRLRIPLDRDTLRPVFYSQCFVTAPISMLVGFAFAVSHTGAAAGGSIALVICLLTLCWYLAQQSLWFRSKLQTSMLVGFANALGATLAAAVIIIVITILCIFAAKKAG